MRNLLITTAAVLIVCICASLAFAFAEDYTLGPGLSKNYKFDSKRVSVKKTAGTARIQVYYWNGRSWVPVEESRREGVFSMQCEGPTEIKVSNTSKSGNATYRLSTNP